MFLEEERPVQEINLYDLLKHYKNYLIIILICALIGFGGGLAYNKKIQKPQYKSQATLLLVTNNQSVSTYDTTLINNYIALFKSQSTLQPVINKLHLNQDYNSLSKELSATNTGNNLVINLSLTSSNPNKASDILNQTLKTFQDEIQHLYGTNNVKIVDYASPNYTPSNIHSSLQLASATAITTLFALIVIFFHYDYNLNNKTAKKNKKKSKLNNRNLLRPVRATIRAPRTFARSIKYNFYKYDLLEDETKNNKVKKKD